MGFFKLSINIKNIIFDKCKIDRAKARLKLNAHQRNGRKIENLVCIGGISYKEIVKANKKKKQKKQRDGTPLL